MGAIQRIPGKEGGKEELRCMIGSLICFEMIKIVINQRLSEF
jgi:hypothetical protein